MSELYLIFFGVGILLFGGIVGFSVYQQRRQGSEVKSKLEGKTAKVLAAKKRLKKSQKKKDLSPSLNESDHAISAPAEQRPAVNETADSEPENVKSTLVTEPSTEALSAMEPAFSDEQETELDDSKPYEKIEPQLSSSKPVRETSATIHQAKLAPKPKMDKDSSTVVTDLVARIKNPDPVEQQQLLSIFRKHDFKFHRKVHIYGLNQLTDMWRDIEFELPSARFLELGISIQLADRDGAMSQKELHDFQQMVLEFTNAFDAPFEFSMDIDDALKQSLALDQIGRRYDSMAVLNVVPKTKTGFRMADIESCARDLMMSTDKNGIFMKTSGQKNNITVHFRLACTDDTGQFGISSGSSKSVHDLVVYMNVPATKDPELVFQEMVKDANSLATWLEGKVVDRHGRHMTQRSYSTLMQQVSDIAFSMQQDGFTPGDAVAKKLF